MHDVYPPPGHGWICKLAVHPWASGHHPVMCVMFKLIVLQKQDHVSSPAHHHHRRSRFPSTARKSFTVPTFIIDSSSFFSLSSSLEKQVTVSSFIYAGYWLQRMMTSAKFTNADKLTTYVMGKSSPCIRIFYYVFTHCLEEAGNRRKKFFWAW